ncbi:MAG: outer membrane beta-barrel family protein, partial [Chitinophagales bacterium]
SNIYVFNADIEHPTKYGAWQYGIKLTHFSTNSNNEQSILQADNTTYLLDTTRSSVFNYKEYTEAIYGSFNKSFEKVELQLGMRLEFTQLKGTLINTNEVNKQQYVRPFPSVMIQYNINENHTINYSITSGIDRPSSWQLNPFRYYINNYTYAEGNPFILPDYGISTALDYTLNDSYMFSIYYNYNNNSIGQVSYVDSITNISHYRWEAGRKVHDVGFYNEYNFSIKDRWLPSISIDAYIDFLKSPFLHNATERKYWSLDLKISNDFIFDTKNRFSGNLNYYFRPNGIGQEELTMRAIHSLSFGLKAQLLKEKQLILSVNAENVLRNKPTNGYKRTPTGEYFSFTNYYDERFFRFTATYKFGNNQLKTKTKQINNEDINRVN